MTTPERAGPGLASVIDPFIVGLLVCASLGLLIPARGIAASAVDVLKTAAIALLFFLQGVRLQRAAVIAGMTHWRLQLLTLVATFVLFPILGLLLHAVFPAALDRVLWLGVLYLCTLPSTVQSSIAFTSIARGNVPAAICAATASNLIGIVLTPVLVASLLNLHGGSTSPLEEIESIVLQLLVPFIAGQVLSRWLRPWALRHAVLLTVSDRGSILLVVYAAFSAATLSGAWRDVRWPQLLQLLLISVFLLAVALSATRLASRAAGFSREDEIATVFCGSKKSLATGVPMANILFPPAAAGLIILPVMLFHQIQLMACAYLARRYAATAPAGTPGAAPAARAGLRTDHRSG
ncbi:MAG TPA: bile acid:sodium symporter family protein [Steroidobacteraceae bacterium]|nr:bile acid:sodium symporter family protein [Steroidobacteraceae bacterium]